MKRICLILVVLTFAACNKTEAPQPPAAAEQPAPEPTAVAPSEQAMAPDSTALPSAPPPPADTPPFADKVWKVKASSAVAVDTTYTFLSGGALVIDSHEGLPAYGKWTYTNGALTMIEEGQPYPTDILRLDDEVFEIRSNNPGQPVTITLVPAVGMPLPPAPAD